MTVIRFLETQLKAQSHWCAALCVSAIAYPVVYQISSKNPYASSNKVI